MVVTKKIILTALLVVVLFHVAWYAASRSFQNAKLPHGATVRAAFDKLLKDEKISIDPYFLMKTDLAKPVEKIKVPVMLVHAENDSIFPQAYVEDIFNRLTCRKKYLFFKNTEHLVMTNNVDDVVPPIDAWLRDVM